MFSVQHLNFGWLHAPPFPPACCHGLLIRTPTGIALVETGIGLADIADPEARIGREAISAAGFQFLPSVTAVRQLEALGISPGDVTDIVLTHCDPDHAGGLADFPNANVHVSAEEKRNLDTGNPRYRPAQFSHEPRWVIHDRDDSEMLGQPTRQIRTALDVDIRLVPLFGHTHGHCGVAISADGRWLLQWTEGGAGERVVRVQILGADLAPLGDALRVSAAGKEAGQGVIAVAGDKAASFQLVKGDKGYELWGTALGVK